MTAANTTARRGALGSARTAAARVIRDPSAILLACQLIGAGVAFLANILAARALAPSGRGELALLLQIGYMTSLVLLLGTNRSVVAVYSGRSARTVSRAFVRLLAVPCAVCLAAVVAVLALPAPVLESWRTGLALALVFGAANAFVLAVRAISIACGRQNEYLAYSLTDNALMLVLLGLLAVLGVATSDVWVAAYVLVAVLPTLAWFVRFYRMRAASTPVEPVSPAVGVRAARREGLQLFPSAMANTGMLRLDRLLLAGLASTSALGLYATVGTMTELIAWPLIAYADARLGRWRAAFDAGELRVRSILLGAVGYSLLAAAAVGTVLHLLLVPLLGPAYEPARALIVPLVAAAGIFGLAQVVITLLIATRHNTAASAAEVSGFAVSVVAYVVLIRDMGALGAAVGSLVGYSACLAVAGTVLGLILLRRATSQR